ncbi:conserved hypothetical protein [Neospora caninum Liverpool]|uniref:Uncharacterized protein n=1 Tax=Neospora caninum (strain Liverpool) TaxID=572307 RepID=F0VHZ1_NEOCL|nr:conserved hypothetical protein [Neospora caninum Liverpool]CBZ53352.1 conserved hypothetical protein [Neospora caninum Liverpool]CEL67338.1 TPA: hypothetical protein BN1204_031390 [Neospora caninum Liverpool]|eukprot:XP_003883384.1 conserved hypothetical protein [Neospora caninum Liverpool]
MQSGEEAVLSFSSSTNALPAPHALPVPVSLTRGRGASPSEGDRDSGSEARCQEEASDFPGASGNWNPYNLVALEKPEECLSIGAAFTETCLSFAVDGRLTAEQILFLEQIFKKAVATHLTDCVRSSSAAAPGQLRRASAKKLPSTGSRAWALKGTCLSFKREGEATRMILENASLNIKGLFLPCKRLCLVDLAGRQSKKRRLL